MNEYYDTLNPVSMYNMSESDLFDMCVEELGDGAFNVITEYWFNAGAEVACLVSREIEEYIACEPGEPVDEMELLLNIFCKLRAEKMKPGIQLIQIIDDLGLTVE